MLNALITHLQLFGIGFSLGIAGPCLLVCTPALLAYTSGTKRRWSGVLGDVLTFLSGRLAAYICLGFLAGLSALVLRRFINSGLISFFKPAAGIFTIILGVLVFVYKDTDTCECRSNGKRIYNFGGLFVFGFLIGITPCAPLTALLFEIVLISKNGLEGASYALSFGLGTALSGLIVLGLLGGALARLPVNVLKSNTARIVFKWICSIFLISMGLVLIIL